MMMNFGIQKWPVNSNCKYQLFVIYVKYFSYNAYNYFRFYTNCILPKIIDPLFGRRLSVEDIRDPPSILEAQTIHNQQLAAKRQMVKRIT